MLSMIQMNLGMKGPYESIAQLIKELKDQINSINSEEQRNYNTFVSSTNSDLEAERQKLEKEEGQLSAEKDSLATAQSQLSTAKSNLASAQSELTSLVEKLANADAENTRAINEYNDKIKELTEVIASCNEAIHILQTGFKTSTISFIMVSFNTQLEKVKAAVNKHLKKSSSVYGPMINVLTDLAQSADSSSINQIVALIGKLRDALQAELESVKSSEVKRAQDYADTKSQLEKQKSAAETNISNYSQEISDLTTRIGRHQTNISAFEQNIAGIKSTIELLSSRLAKRKLDYEANQKAR